MLAQKRPWQYRWGGIRVVGRTIVGNLSFRSPRIATVHVTLSLPRPLVGQISCWLLTCIITEWSCMLTDLMTLTLLPQVFIFRLLLMCRYATLQPPCIRTIPLFIWKIWVVSRSLGPFPPGGPSTVRSLVPRVRALAGLSPAG